MNISLFFVIPIRSDRLTLVQNKTSVNKKLPSKDAAEQLEVGMGDPTLKSEFRDRHFTQPPLAHLGRFYILGFAYDCKLPPRNAKKLNRTCAAPWSPVVSQHWQLTLLVFVQF